MLAGEGIHNAGSQLFHIGAVDALADFLDQHGVGLADIEHKVLLLIGEQAADHIVGRDIAAADHPHDEHHAGNIGGKVQFPCLSVDIAGQDVVQHHVLDKVGLIELFVVVLLDALQADGQYTGKLPCSLVGALHEHGIIVMLGVGELLVSIAVAHKAVACGQTLGHIALAHFADQVQLRAGNDSASLIHNADHPIDCVLHLVDHALKYSIGHKWIPLFLVCASRGGMGCDFKQFSRITIYILHKRIYFCNRFQQKK